MDSSDSDIDFIVSSLMLVASTIYRRRQLRVRTRNRTIWARHWISKREEYGAYNGLVREIRVNDTASYRNFLRMDDTSFDTLLHKVSPLIARQDTRMRCAVPADERLAVTLRYLATGEMPTHTSLRLAKLNRINAVLFVLLKTAEPI